MTLLLDINEVAAALRVGRRTAYVLRARPDFPRPVTLASRIVRYRRSDVETFVQQLAADAAPSAEPDRLKAGKDAKRGSSGRSNGGTLTPNPAKAQPARTSAERSSVEPETERQK